MYLFLIYIFMPSFCDPFQYFPFIYTYKSVSII